MKPIIAGCLLLITLTVRAQQPATVADALTVERLRIDDTRADAATLIRNAADRFVSYHPLAQNRAEVRRLYRAFKTYSHGVLERTRRQLEAVKERTRTRRGSRA